MKLAEDSGHARIEVSDRGLGVLQVERERIFEEKFYRLDLAFSRAGGTGLGLYISRELVERMHGRVCRAPPRRRVDVRGRAAALLGLILRGEACRAPTGSR